ncbi:hypothetical protein ACFL6X_02195 [Candidatus Latescibacterota bacterium]
MEAYCTGYGAGRVSLSGPDQLAHSVVGPSIQIRHWWDAFGILHPRTIEGLEETLEQLSQLKSAAVG